MTLIYDGEGWDIILIPARVSKELNVWFSKKEHRKDLPGGKYEPRMEIDRFYIVDKQKWGIL